MYWILLLIPSRKFEVCMPLTAMFLDDKNNWGELKRAPHKSLIWENRCTFVCMRVCIYVCPNMSTCSSHTRVGACARIHTVNIVSVDRMLTLNVAHQTTEACFEAQAEEIETRKRRGRDQYTRVLSFCSNKTIYDPYHMYGKAVSGKACLPATQDSSRGSWLYCTGSQ